MNLAEYQRAVIRASFAVEPTDETFVALGNPERFRLYRHMIRTRLCGMAEVAFKVALVASGAEAFGRCFADYLAAQPPRSPLIRDVIADFGPFAREHEGLVREGPVHLVDLLLFEETKWRLAYAACERPRLGEAGVRELDFDGVPVFNPVLRTLALSYAVHTLVVSEPAQPPSAPLVLLVYRPDRNDDVRWYGAEPLFAGLVRRAGENPTATLAELVREVADEQGRALDAALLESLATSLTLALERGVLVGVR